MTQSRYALAKRPHNAETDTVHMFPLLAIDAATSAGTVALFSSANEVRHCAVRMGASREDTLLPAIDALCREAHIAARDIRRVICGAGPGSFTSLRIAASIAKGIAHANGAALYTVSSLMFAAAALDETGEYLVHADAMRGERFVQQVVVHSDGSVDARGEVFRMRATDLAQPHTAPPVHATLPSAQAASSSAIVTLPPAIATLRRVAVTSPAFVDSDEAIVFPDARRVLRIASWPTAGPVDLASWEPHYGRLAEAQVQWENAHGTPLPSGTTQ